MINAHNENPVPNWLPIVAITIGLFTLLFFMGLVTMSIFIREVPCGSRFLVVIILSLGASLALGLWGGTVAAEGKISLPYIQNHPIVFGATGGIAALIVVMLLGNWLYSERDCFQPSNGNGEVSNRINAMYTNLNQKSYDAALAISDEILKTEPDNYRALNVKGTVAFYRRRFQDAVKYFDQAYNVKAHPTIGRNLADAYVEIGAYALAIKTYLAANTSTEEWHYSIGRAYVFAGQYDDALAHLQVVKSDIKKRAVQIMLAATYIGKSLFETDNNKRDELLIQARKEMKEVCSVYPVFWNQILLGIKNVEYETYDKILLLLEKIYVDGKPCS